MRALKLITIAVITAAFTPHAFASGDAAQLAAHKRAYELRHAQSAAVQSHKVDLACHLKHPSERVRS